MSSKRIGKYACVELERRYLLAQLPNNITTGWQITDRYLIGTRLRLRRMSQPSTGKVLYKFGQKYQAEEQPATHTTITNIYLNETEYQTLSQLPAHELNKLRYALHANNRRYSVDQFQGALAGLILAETECETEADVASLTLPAFALKEVTTEPFFKGGHLVTLPRENFIAQLTRWLQ